MIVEGITISDETYRDFAKLAKGTPFHVDQIILFYVRLRKEKFAKWQALAYLPHFLTINQNLGISIDKFIEEFEKLKG